VLKREMKEFPELNTYVFDKNPIDTILPKILELSLEDLKKEIEE